MRLPPFRHGPAADVDAPSWSDGDDRPVAEVLERYAVEALSPDEATLSRMGTAVRAAFVAAVMERNEDLAPEEAPLAGDRGRRRTLSWNRRRAVAAIGVVAILTLSTVGLAAAQSGPGQPFYRIRLGIESVNLPQDGSQDRLDADLNRADVRLDEVAGSAAISDWHGAADAANAYGDVIGGVALPADPTSKGRALQHLDAQLTRLEQLRATSRGVETTALDKAIAALCGILGIAVPTPPASPSANSISRPSDPKRTPAAATPRPTGSDPDGGRDSGVSATPSASRSPDGSGNPAASDEPRPNNSAGKHDGQTPKPSDDHGFPADTNPPVGGH